jgi:hypothetical protein
MAAPTPEQIIVCAKEIHGHYRAAFKALHQGGTQFVDGTGCKNEHDHGWSHCRDKAYFLRRAVRTLKVRNAEPTPF